MVPSPEWFVPRGDDRLVVVLPDRLDSPPARAAVSGRGRVVVETEAGATIALHAPDRKVATLLARRPTLVLSEPPGPGSPRRTTQIETAAPAPGGMVPS